MFVVPVTLAVKACVCEAVRLAEVGLTVTATLDELEDVVTNVSDARAIFVESAAEVAVTVTDCWVETEEGAR